jgi:hypothetical protein
MDYIKLKDQLKSEGFSENVITFVIAITALGMGISGRSRSHDYDIFYFRTNAHRFKEDFDLAFSIWEVVDTWDIINNPDNSGIKKTFTELLMEAV